jgi:hypothetical protein
MVVLGLKCALFIVQIFAMGVMKLAAEWSQQMDPSGAGRPGLV